MDQFSRIEQLLGSDAMKQIKTARVAVFGLGAVGSFTVEALARSGVGFLHLVDFDRVDATNINRQLYALHSTIGKEKAEVAQARIQDINPGCEVAVHSTFVNADSLAGLLTPDFDIVVDAIDGLNSKVNLIVEAKEMGVKIVSSMGAAGRTDITMIRSGDLFETSICPLARVVRRRLRRRGIETGVPCIYSIEPPRNKSPFNDQNAYDPLDGHGRPRPPIGSTAWVPGAFGLALAGEAIQILIHT
ncbi:MAG: tRNA threonylcarbamoyladenosine dehydratase [Desulfobacterales bacterium]|nr:MAG: tRNA threonylcarbamoyladenosine dehydratase [Desulfobacterales bacterium]